MGGMPRPTRAWIRGLPKAELHVHLEGTLEPELLLHLARRNGVSLPWADTAAVRAAYAFGNLQEFLDLYYQGMGVLRSGEDFAALARAAVERAADDGVVHAEFFYDPQGHTGRGLDFVEVTEGLLRGLAEAAAARGLTWRLIPNILRHLPEEDALAMLAQAEPWLREGRLHGVGLDSSELGHPPAGFRRAFAWAGERGFFRTAHAGEEGPWEYVEAALDQLGVDRIDHGNHALDHGPLVARLVEGRVGMTVCPLSNLRLQGVASLAEHPLRRMLEAGLVVSVNSDDPAYFGGYCVDNLVAVTEALGLDEAQLRTLARNSVETSQLAPEDKARWTTTIDAYAG